MMISQGYQASAVQEKQHSTGRPIKFSSPDALQEKIEAYFKHCQQAEEIPGVIGLAAHLRTTRETLGVFASGDYDHKALGLDGSTFSDVLKNTRERIVARWEQRLAGNAPTGSIFYLKNFGGMADRQEVSHTGPGGGPLQVVTAHLGERDATSLFLDHLKSAGQLPPPVEVEPESDSEA